MDAKLLNYIMKTLFFMMKKQTKSNKIVFFYIYILLKRELTEDIKPYEVLIKIGRDEIIARKYDLELLYELEAKEKNPNILLPKINYLLRD